MAISLTTGEAMEPVAWRKVVGDVTRYYAYNEMGEGEPLYAAPVDAKAIRDELEVTKRCLLQMQEAAKAIQAEALEEAAKVCDELFGGECIAAAIRGLK